MSNFLANIIKGIVGRLKPPTHQGRFKSIGWLQEKILKHEDDQQEKSKTLNGMPVYYQRPYELLHTYDELFVGEMYRFQAVTDQPVILDCGANIGLSVLYFKQLYPHANIWAFEPDENNFRLLEKNIAVNHLSHVYKFVYAAVPPKKLKVAIRGMLDKWYSKMVNELEGLPSKIEEMGCPRKFSR